MSYEWMYARSRNKDGLLRKKRSDAKVDSKIKENLGCREDKTIGSLLRNLDVASVSEARRKLKLS